VTRVSGARALPSLMDERTGSYSQPGRILSARGDAHHDRGGEGHRATDWQAGSSRSSAGKRRPYLWRGLCVVVAGDINYSGSMLKGDRIPRGGKIRCESRMC